LMPCSRSHHGLQRVGWGSPTPSPCTGTINRL
jgi:hypothetical protein